MKRILILLIILLPSLVSSQTLTAYRGKVSNSYNFWVSTPKDYDSLSSEKPIILFLHGASLCGSNLERVRRYGPLNALAMGRQIDAVIIAPQNPGGAWNPEKVNRIVDWVFENYPGDTNRFYVIGMSLGGYGTIDYSAAYSSPMCYEIAPKGVNKAKSIERLASILGCNNNQILSFGDMPNDLPMLENSTGVVMDNASDEMKAKIKLHTSAVDKMGVYEFLNNNKLI